MAAAGRLAADMLAVGIGEAALGRASAATGAGRARRARGGSMASRMLVVGAGVVGSASGAAFQALGHEVAYHDVDPARVAALRAEGRAIWTPAESRGADFVWICVDTPNADGAADLSRVRAACRWL